MAKEKPSIPKGTRDFGPQEVAKRKYILNTIEQVFIKYGFMPIETPTMENLSTLTGKYGDEGDKLLFKILNSGDYLKELNPEILSSNNIPQATKLIAEKGLRYDLTVPFARYVVMHQNEITFPFKRYQMQPVWRADKPQKGRYREFWQCDADVVGSDSLLNELDLIQIYNEVFSQLGIPYELRINNRKILAGIAQVVKGIEHLMTISVAIDKLDKIGMEGVSKELSVLDFSATEIATLFEIIAIKGTNEEMLALLTQKLQSSNEGLKGIEELAYIFNLLKETAAQEINLKIDFSLARGLSYYTGCIFEVAATEGTLKSSIGGGGRYDNLTGIFGLNGVSGVGISFGLDRIYDVLEELNLFPPTLNQSSTKVLVCCMDESQIGNALGMLKQLRSAGIASEIYADRVNPKKPLEKPMKYATGKKIPYAILYNIDNSLTLKNLLANTQENLLLENIITLLLEPNS